MLPIDLEDLALIYVDQNRSDQPTVEEAAWNKSSSGIIPKRTIASWLPHSSMQRLVPADQSGDGLDVLYGEPLIVSTPSVSQINSK